MKFTVNQEMGSGMLEMNTRSRAAEAGSFLTRNPNSETRIRQAGYSLIELLIAMTITLVLMVAASTLLAKSFSMRSRENRKSDGLADAGRALNQMSRELASSGFALTDNGLVAGAQDSNGTAIHFRTNLNNTNETTSDPDEDVYYSFQAASFALIRHDKNTGAASELADGIDSLQITYYDINGAILNVNGTPATVAAAVRLTIAVSVVMPPLKGVPPSSVSLSSDVTLRNAQKILDRY
jgi:prepilin-type N-terminal cleavage/methylation domain-containing protein